MAQHCRATSTLRSAPDTPPKEATSLSLPQMAAHAGFCAPTSPNTPYLQLPKGLEWKDFDGPWEAKTWDMDQLKKKNNNTQVTEVQHMSVSLASLP